MKRTIFLFKDTVQSPVTQAVTGDINLTTDTDTSGEVEIEFELAVDGSVTEAGETDWDFSTEPGTSDENGVSGYGVTIVRAPANQSGEKVGGDDDPQFSVKLNSKNHPVITDEDSDQSAQGTGAGQFEFTVTVYGTKDGQQISATTDPMIYNKR